MWKQYSAYKWNYDFLKNRWAILKWDYTASYKADPEAIRFEPTTKMRFSEYLKLIETEPTDFTIIFFSDF
ncbi:MAG: hypothetical protein IPI65_17165 [Bacteroidetes bacterium]|nr:hypothetical protein [Bacteroidota bacterium]